VGTTSNAAKQRWNSDHYTQVKVAPQVLTATRRQRRNAMKALHACLEQIRDSEESYRDNIPENLQGGSAYDIADECVSILSEAIELLESAYQ